MSVTVGINGSVLAEGKGVAATNLGEIRMYCGACGVVGIGHVLFERDGEMGKVGVLYK